jgi:biopolymer transport protein ExbD
MKRLLKKLIAAFVVLNPFPLILCVAALQPERAESKPVVLSVQIEHGSSVYKLNGKTVEDRRENSLLNNLGQVATDRGSNTVVFVVIDEKAPFTEVGKLETALDKIDMPNRRLFMADFADGTMNEIHLDPKALPIPRE